MNHPGLKDRIQQILSIVPKDVDSILDIGCGDKEFKPYFNTYISLDYKDADIIQDLNKKQKIDKQQSKSVDMVILSQILEHLVDPSVLINETKRIAKKYILVGLPNEITIDNRFRYLFGMPSAHGYQPYWHKHFYIISSIEDFIKKFFNQYEKKYYLFGVRGGRFLPIKLRKILANLSPSLCTKEVYYLIKV